MNDRVENGAGGGALERQLESVLNGDRFLDSPDWSRTVEDLMGLAKEANKAFDFDKAINYLTTLEDIWKSRGLPEYSLGQRFELHQEKGKAYASQGKLDLAIAEYQKTLDFCRDSSHLNTRSETFIQIGQLLAKQGEHDRALGYLQRAMGAYRRLDDRIGQCKTLRNIGVVYVELGEFEEAEVNYDEAIALAQSEGNRLLYADLVNNLGTISNMKGNWHRALDLYRESLDIYREHNEIRKSAYTENNLAITFNEQGMDNEAFEFFRRAYDTATEIKDASLTLIVDINLADLYLKRGALPEARQHCLKARDYLVENNLTNGHLVETEKIAGKLAREEKQYKSAKESFDRAHDICRKINARFLEAEVLKERGALFMVMNRPFDALSDLEASYHLYTTLEVEEKKEQTERVINSIESLYLDIFDAMAKDVDRKDPYTKGHSDRVASLALLLARELGLRTSMLKTVVAAALLHDIGKVKIDDAILKKAGRLTEEEFHAIQKHPELGVEMLRGKEFPWDIKPCILHHHEKLNGRGYPLGLKGEDIPLGARIICIADVFDALTSNRVYRAAYDTEKALAIMNDEAGTSFDPVLLRCFVDMINEGRADLVINSKTDEDEMYGIWSRCMHESAPDPEKSPQTVAR